MFQQLGVDIVTSNAPSTHHTPLWCPWILQQGAGVASRAAPDAAARPCAGRILLSPVEEGDWGQWDMGEAHLGDTEWDCECAFESECVCVHRFTLFCDL